MLSWRPSDSGGRVDLAEVEQSAARLCREYRTTRLRFDRMQAEQLTTNLGRVGVRTSEFVFSTAGANRLARSLYVALRDRAVELPDDAELITELSSVRLVETGPGTVKMINPPGTHDDLAVAVGMIIADLTEQPDIGRGSIGLPHLLAAPKINRTNRDGRPSPSARLAAKQARRKGPRGVNWIPVPGSANDPASTSTPADADLARMRGLWERRPH